VEENVSNWCGGQLKYSLASIRIRSIIATVKSNVRPDGAMAIMIKRFWKKTFGYPFGR
jgi:hypothetical protein